ncbi:MAG: hypothetical protein WCO60_05950 [Verrucomicrobiota bacterium]
MSKRILSAGVLALATGIAVYQTWLVNAHSQGLVDRQQQVAALTEERQHLRAEHDDSTSRLNQIEESIARQTNARQQTETAAASQSPTPPGSDPFTESVNSLKGEAELLHDRLFRQRPGAEIPELNLLNASDWLLFTQMLSQVFGDHMPATEAEIRKASAIFREKAKSVFQLNLQQAIRAFAQANNGQQPTEISQLRDYFEAPVDIAMLQRYRVVSSTALPDEYQNRIFASGPESVVLEKQAVDPQYEEVTMTTRKGASFMPLGFRLKTP